MGASIAWTGLLMKGFVFCGTNWKWEYQLKMVQTKVCEMLFFFRGFVGEKLRGFVGEKVAA